MYVCVLAGVDGKSYVRDRRPTADRGGWMLRDSHSTGPKTNYSNANVTISGSVIGIWRYIQATIAAVASLVDLGIRDR